MPERNLNTAINDAKEIERNNAYEAFVSDVRHQMRIIEELSTKLKKAKTQLAEMKYQEPIFENI